MQSKSSFRSRVGIVLKSYLGDAVMATPLIFSLGNSVFEPIILSSSPADHLLKGRVPGEVIHIEKAKSWRGIIMQARQIRSLELDSILLINRSFRCALIARLAKVKVRSGHSTECRKRLLTHSYSYSKTLFESACYNELAQPIASINDFGFPRLKVKVAPIAASNPQVAIQPGARYDAKRISLSTLAEIASYCVDCGYEVVLVGGQEERPLASEMERRTGMRLRNMVGTTNFNQLIEVLQRVKIVIGSDTGLMHIAAAIGTPTLTVFGPNPASKWGHEYPPHMIIEADGGDISRVTTCGILKVLTQSLNSAYRDNVIA